MYVMEKLVELLTEFYGCDSICAGGDCHSSRKEIDYG